VLVCLIRILQFEIHFVRLLLEITIVIFLEPMDWITNRAAHKGFLGVTVGQEICPDTDDV